MSGYAELEHELEAAALELEGETAAEGMDALDQIRDAWRSLPPDVKQDIQRRAKLMWELRGAYFARFVAAVNALVRSDPAIRHNLILNRDAAIGQIALRAGQMAQLPPRAPIARPGFSDTQVRQYRARQLARGRVPGRARRSGRYRELELELEMAAENLSGEAPEAESGADTYRYVDAVVFQNGGWQTLEKFDRFKGTRDYALNLQNTLWWKYNRWAQDQGLPFQARCLTYSPTQNRWLNCQDYSG